MQTVFGTPNFLLATDAIAATMRSQHEVALFANFTLGCQVTLLMSFVSSSAVAGS